MIIANGESFDLEAVLVMQTITNASEYPITTSEVRTRAGMKNADLVRRRFEDLRDAGFLTMQKGRDRYRNEIWEVEPTAEGTEWMDAHTDLLDEEGSLEKELTKMQSRIGSIEYELEELEEEVASDSGAGSSLETFERETDGEVGKNVASRLQNLREEFDTHREQTKEAVGDIIEEQNELRIEFDAFLQYFFEAMTAAERENYEAVTDDVRKEYLGDDS